MRNIIFISLLAIIISSCNNNDSKSKVDSDNSYETALAEIKGANKHQAKVLEALHAGSYSYLKLEENNNEFWAAVSIRPIVVGNKYYYEEGFEMKDFHSKSLERTFESIYFIQEFSEQPIQKQKQEVKPQAHATETNVESIEVIEPLDGGVSIKELFSNKASFEGKEVLIKGKIVKMNQNIMSRNWIHLQDGTKFENDNDLTITTTEVINYAVGDIVVFKGKITLNKDFGAGYAYALIMEDAVIQKSL